MLGLCYSSSIGRWCRYHHHCLLIVAIICILSIISSVDGFSTTSTSSSNLETIRRHAKNGINKHQSYNSVPLLTSSIYNDYYNTSIRSYNNAKQSTTLYAKKKSPSSSDNDDSSSSSNKWTNPGNLIIAPFVLIFGLDLILNILAITRRSIEYVLTGDVSCIGSWC